MADRRTNIDRFGNVSPNGNGRAPSERARQRLGMIVRGSLSDGLELRLDSTTDLEDLRVGRFVVVEGERTDFFAMLSDLQLNATHPDFLNAPPENDLAADVLRGACLFTTAKIRPMLMAERDADQPNLLPVKTIPPHFAVTYEADSNDVARVFGSEDQGDAFFKIGEPLDMDTPICVNLDRWVERSNAIFGKSGTGKTFLTRILLCGAIRSGKAVNLIFDMHNEYGWQGTNEDPNRRTTRGLKQLFQSRVKVYTLDRDSSMRRNVPIEFEVKIPLGHVAVEDVLLLARELNLSLTAAENCYLLYNEFRDGWLERFLAMQPSELQEFAVEKNAHPGALSALHRKLGQLRTQCDFLVPSNSPHPDAVTHLLGTLRTGCSVVIEFGRYDRPLQYMLVANILTRRLHDIYVKDTERAMSGGGERPRPLMIAIEEAHKFLSPQLADQTIFGTIAREMRKYNVTLLIVDQRPSGIDTEILSQVGTKVCCLLDDERDVDAALSGVSGASALRSVLSSLETRQQALIFGHAVPMPIVVRTRTYDDDSFRASMANGSTTELPVPQDWQAREAKFQRDRELDFPG